MAELESQARSADSGAHALNQCRGERPLCSSETSSVDGTILGLVLGSDPKRQVAICQDGGWRPQ